MALHHPLQDIQDLRNSLLDNYPPQSILKELIQNAEDANSTCFDYGWSRGIKDAEHPLLQSSGIFILDNGKFTLEDADNIQYFKGSGKHKEDQSEQDFIGKFGLGLKSVFHICEAFFYISNWKQTQDENGDTILGYGFFNPWAHNNNDDEYHPNWKNLSERDRDLVEQEIQPILRKEDYNQRSWLLIWIPLRKKEHQTNDRDQKYGWIKQNFYENENEIDYLFSKDKEDKEEIRYQLALLLPLLRCLIKIRYWNNNFLTPLFEVSNSNEQKQSIKNISPNKIIDNSGYISFNDQQNSNISFHFCSSEIRSTELKEDFFKLNNRDQSFDKEIEKTTPYIEIALTRLPNLNDDNNLNIRTAIFLPTEQNCQLSIESRDKYLITLNGSFFPDSSRKGILGFNSNNFQIQEQHQDPRIIWNKKLYEKLLSILLKALEYFYNEVQSDLEENLDQEIEALCSGLKKSLSNNSKNQEIIYKDNAWVYLLKPDHSKWELISTHKRIIALRSFFNDLWTELPALKDFADKYYLTVKGKSNLIKENQLNTFEELELVKLFESINSTSIFQSPKREKFLFPFLEEFKQQLSINAVNCLLEKISNFLNPNQDTANLIYNIINYLGCEEINLINLSYIPVYSVKQECSYYCHPDEIRKQIDKSVIFKDNINNKKILNDLQDVLEKEVLLLIDKNLAQQLWPQEIETFSDQACFDILCRKPLLTDDDLTKRESILKQLLASNCNHSKKKQAIRFLLHNHVKHFDDSSTPLYIQPSSINQVWKKIAHQTLQPWQVLETRLAHNIPEEQWQFFNIKPISPDSLIQQLTPEEITGDILPTPEERDEVLKEVAKNRENKFLWKRLPLHQASDGRLVSISHTTTYQQNPEFPIHSRLRSLVTLIEKTNRPDWIPRWTPKVAVEVILQQSQPEQYSELLFELVRDRSEVSDDQKLFKRLQEVPWLNLAVGASIRPERVILLPDRLQDFTPLLQKVFESENSVYVTKDQLSNFSIQEKKTLEQKKLCPSWYENDLLSFLLEEIPEPFLYSKEVLELLNIIEKWRQSISNKNLEKLRITKWLLDDKKQPQSPQQILHLPSLTDEATEILQQLASWDYITPSMLRDDLDIGFCLESPHLQDLFLSGDSAIEKLGEAIAQLPEYYIGNLDPDEILRKVLIRFLSNCELMPIWKIASKISEEQFESYILPNILQPIRDMEWVCHLLNWITESNLNFDKELIKIYNLYLKLLVDYYSAELFTRDILPRIKLLNQKQKWEFPKQLCDGEKYTQIDPVSVVNNEQRNIIADKLLDVPDNIKPFIQEESNSKNKESKKQKLEKYFHPWLSYLPSEAIGGFISLLAGTDKNIHNLAKKYLKNRSFDELRERLLWSEQYRNRNFQIQIKSAKETTHEVNNLLGQPLRVNIYQQKIPQDIFIGQLNNSTQKITLREFQLPEESDLAQVLINSVKKLIEKVFQTYVEESIETIWNDLLQSQQLYVKHTQKYIKKHLEVILPFLSVKNQKLEKYINDIWELDKEMDELEDRFDANARSKFEPIKNQLEETRQNLIKLVETDPEVANDILQAIRNKIGQGQYGYSVTSIPFELFQNADDSLTELEKIFDKKLPERSHFVFKINNNELIIMHWGRPINLATHPDATNQKIKGFNRDLDKMLYFNMSDKDHQETGKFGLGFKTVHLISQTPYIISGDLKFIIQGGLLPFALPRHNYQDEDEKELEFLQQELQQFRLSSEVRDGTIIKLPIDQNSQVNTEKLVDEFRDKAGLLLVFANRIKSCNFINASTPIQQSWKPLNILSIEGIEYGKIQLPVHQKNISKKQFYQLFCFRLNAGEVVIALPSKLENSSPLTKMPTFWVTTPTRESLGLRFLVNGNFDITTGRTSLDRNSTHNQYLMTQIGKELGEKLEQLFQESYGNWQALRQMLKLSEQVDFYDFWEFLWEVLAVDWLNLNSNEISSQLLQDGFGGQERSLGYLISSHAALPNGLSGSTRQLVRLDQVNYIVTGLLSKKEIFEEVASWSQFQANYPAQYLLHKKVWQNLEKLLNTNSYKPKSLTLVEVLNQQLGNRNISPDHAYLLGRLIKPDQLRNWKGSHPSEYNQIENVINNNPIFFMNQQEGYVAASLLLNPRTTHEEEKRLVDFAPSNRILHLDYTDQALEFFLSCRPRRETISIENLVSWATNVNTDEQKNAVRVYLLKGERSIEFGNQLREASAGTWIEKDDGIKPLLRINLTQNRAEQANRGECSWSQVAQETPNNTDLQSDETATISNEINVEQFLQSLSKWWQRNYKTQLDKYNKRLYPIEIGKLKDRLKQRDDREAWLILFFIGVTHTIGRISYEQSRNFVKVGMDRGWWDIFSEPEPKENPEQWISILDQYIDHLDNDSTWYSWMEKYPHIYQISKYLEVYQDLFLRANKWSQKWGSQFSVQKLVSPRSNEQLSGGGWDAPPLSIRMGANFVLRELIRLELIEPTRELIPYCFVPRQNIKKILTNLGCQNLDLEQSQNFDEDSKSIYEFLKENGVEDFTFNNSFDIAIELYWKYRHKNQ